MQNSIGMGLRIRNAFCIPSTSMGHLGGKSNARVAHLRRGSQQKEPIIRSKADWTIIDQLEFEDFVATT
jgi:hypothetical protein